MGEELFIELHDIRVVAIVTPEGMVLSLRDLQQQVPMQTVAVASEHALTVARGMLEQHIHSQRQVSVDRDALFRLQWQPVSSQNVKQT